jgi:hypothetical protein
MADGDNNGRITTREFYDALLKTNDKMDDMERRILAKIEAIQDRCPHTTQINNNKDEIDKLRQRSNWLDGINAAFAIIAAAIAAALGKAP